MGQAPPEITYPEESRHLVMHTALRLGTVMLMGADALPGQAKAFGGFDISMDDPDKSKVRRIFAALSEGGRVTMPLAPTFWSPLFGMCTDRFGVNWMVSMPGPQA